MERIRKSLRELIFIAFIAVVATAHAQSTTSAEENVDSQQDLGISSDLPPPPGGLSLGAHEFGHGGLAHDISLLNLTTEQQTQVATIESTYRAELQAAEKTLHTAMKALEDSINLSTFDEVAIRLAAATVGDAIAETSVIRGQMQSQINAVLTDEQKQQLESLRVSRQLHRGRGRMSSVASATEG